MCTTQQPQHSNLITWHHYQKSVLVYNAFVMLFGFEIFDVYKQKFPLYYLWFFHVQVIIPSIVMYHFLLP